ncbi:hypothetical protein BH24ACI2_BH24ACI2_15560 [soil metagenome]|jgi:hypothetical protein
MFNLAEIKILFTTLITIFVGISLGCQTTETNHLTKQEYAVYMTVLSEKPENFVVVDETMVDIFGEVSTGYLKELFKELHIETFDNFVLKNKKSSTIEKSFPTKNGYPIISKDDFNKKHSESSRYYVFSRVGFSEDGKQALVLFSDACSPLCGKGVYYLLTNRNGVWEIEKESETWRS